MEKLFDEWAKKVPKWNAKYKDSIFEKFADYGSSSSIETSERHGSVYGAAYEIFIIAFFCGIYSKKRKALPKDSKQLTNFGHPIQFWGNVDPRKKRKPYSDIQKYMFAALIARTNLKFLDLDMGKIRLEDAVNTLISEMEEYANQGLSVLYDLNENNPVFSINPYAFYELFNPRTRSEDEDTTDEITPPPLD